MIAVPKRRTHWKGLPPYTVDKLPEYECEKPAGTFIVFENGSYSSKSTIGVFRVIKSINPIDVAREYYESLAVIENESMNGFMLFLITAGYCEEVTHDVWNIGDCRLFDQ